MTVPVLVIHTDGASRGNPGAAAYGYVVEQDDVVIIEEGDCLGKMTNNEAEYSALIRALEHVTALGTNFSLQIRSDSELMVKQINKQYRVKNEKLKPLYEQVCELLERFVQFDVSHVRRAENKRADELCNEALDGKRTAEFQPDVGEETVMDDEPPPTRTLEEQMIARLQQAKLEWTNLGKNADSAEKVWADLEQILSEHGVSIAQ